MANFDLGFIPEKLKAESCLNFICIDYIKH